MPRRPFIIPLPESWPSPHCSPPSVRRTAKPIAAMEDDMDGYLDGGLASAKAGMRRGMGGGMGVQRSGSFAVMDAGDELNRDKQRKKRVRREAMHGMLHKWHNHVMMEPMRACQGLLSIDIYCVYP